MNRPYLEIVVIYVAHVIYCITTLAEEGYCSVLKITRKELAKQCA